MQAGGEEFGVLFIDLDRFKPVNDTCGHLAGDELLRQISQLFAGRLREEDTLARLGGDEFGIILASCSGPRARQVADACQDEQGVGHRASFWGTKRPGVLKAGRPAWSGTFRRRRRALRWRRG